ncbi:MAG: type I-E CRISPR-associated protein Cse2/CasB [Magnetococcales bacterium]|nr:type I-E CRISPR-associated protein Cse2/CasB [Magnetococcales bacterium]
MNEQAESLDLAGDGLEGKIRLLVSRMARGIEEGGLGTGEMAELRRWRFGGEIHPTAWRLLARHVFSEHEPSRALEDRWLAVLSGMALMAPNHHRSGAAPGWVLATAGYSENRFHKLLNSRHEAFFDAVDRTCRFLRAKGEAVDWTRFAPFILTMDPDKAELQRRTLARDYFSHAQN